MAWIPVAPSAVAWAAVDRPTETWDEVAQLSPLLDTDGNVITDTDGDPIEAAGGQTIWTPNSPNPSPWMPA